MIYPHSLSEETNEIAEKIYNAAEQVKDKVAEVMLKKITDKIYDEIHSVFEEWFSYNLRDNFKEQVAYEVRNILRELLNGNLEVIKNTNLVSEYTFDNLHEIRLGIWKAAGQDIEGCLISTQQKEIEYLKKQVEQAERRWL